jgi:hypothetical protein
MTKLFPPTQWQMFLDSDTDFRDFERLCRANDCLKLFTKTDDIVEGKLGTRYTFATGGTPEQMERWLVEFLKP